MGRGGWAFTSRWLAPMMVLAAAGWSAGVAAQANERSGEGREAQQWLVRIHDAARQSNFQGTFIVTTGTTVASSRIQHFCEGPHQFEKIESLDGQMRHVYRHNELVHSLWPHSRLAVVETRYVSGEFPALISAGAERIAQHYEIKTRGMGRVAGHEARILSLQPKDAFRYGYRLWAEKTTGLLLRAEVVDASDNVLEVSAFTDVTLNVKSRPDLVLQAMKRLEGYAVQRPVLQPVALAQEGWVLRQAPPGFTHVASVRRAFAVAPGEDTTTATVLQTIYSDGMTYVSIFIDTDLASHAQRREAVYSLGATQTLVRRSNEAWFTVIGDVPTLTLRAFAMAMEPRR